MSKEELEHPLVREFRLCKEIQSHVKQGRECKDLVEQFEKLRNTCATSLSLNVHRLLSLQNEDLEKSSKLNKEDILVEKNGVHLLNFQFLSTTFFVNGDFGLISNEEAEDEMFMTAAHHIKAVSIIVHEKFIQKKYGENPQLFLQDYKEYLNLFSQKNVVSWIIEEHLNGDSLFAFMIAVSWFEHGLQDAVAAYLLINNYKKEYLAFTEKQIKINDLLVMKEMKNIFGDDIMFLLRTVMGPLNSLNLRNVTLHGFIMPQEFPSCFTSFLLLFIVSLSEMVKNILKDQTSYQKVVDLSYQTDYNTIIIVEKDLLVNSIIDQRIEKMFDRIVD